LNDVPRVIPCMPGAEFKDVVHDNRWKALMHVKLGPIAVQFDVDIERRDRDDSGRRVTLDAQAREVRGRGGAHATIVSSLAESETGTNVTM
jgi:uncharacterized protein